MEKINIEGKQQQTCLVIMSGLLIFWLVTGHKWLVTVALIIGLIGAFVPYLATGINWMWYKIAEVMGWVMSKVLLSLIFFLFLFPIALLYRMFNKETLQLKRSSGSYWTERKHSYEAKDLEDAW